MSYLLKDLYSPAFYDVVSDALVTIDPGFNKKDFVKRIFTPAFKKMELKERMRHTSLVLHDCLAKNYKAAIEVIKKLAQHFKATGTGQHGFAFIFLADYIQVFGLDDYKTSVKGIEAVTQFISCEFAVRPFLVKYGEQMLNQMLVWSTHKNHHVRRLASEGSRPRLPWGLSVPFLKQNPELVLPILENLKSDPSEYVRRSVANSLNDIAKTHPEIVLALVKKWSGISKETDALIKHGSRTLLKQGHADILKHYGLHGKHVKLADFKILTPTVKTGGHLEFSFSVTNKDSAEQKVRLEYAIFYRMQNGKLSKKVFKISEKIFPSKATAVIQRKQKFTPITTRTFYPGMHQLSIIVNGEEKVSGDFELM